MNMYKQKNKRNFKFYGKNNNELNAEQKNKENRERAPAF